jgi:hypothetical protein
VVEDSDRPRDCLSKRTNFCRDGQDVRGSMQPGHRTIGASRPMSYQDFIKLFHNLPWRLAGKI